MIEIFIQMCGDLPDYDRGKRDLTDAYVKIICNGNTNFTQTIRDSLDPFFRHKIQVESGHFIEFQVYDKDKYTADDLIGKVRITDPVLDNELHNYNLTKKGRVVRGERYKEDGSGEKHESYIRIRFTEVMLSSSNSSIPDTLIRPDIPDTLVRPDVPDLMPATASTSTPIPPPTFTTSAPVPPPTTATSTDPSSMARIRARRRLRRRVAAEEAERQRKNGENNEPHSRALPPLPPISRPTNCCAPVVTGGNPPPPPPPPTSTSSRSTGQSDGQTGGLTGGLTGGMSGGLLADIRKGKTLKNAEDRKVSPVPPPNSRSPHMQAGGNLLSDLAKAMDTRRHAIDDSNDQPSGSGLIFGDLQDDPDPWAP